MDMIRQRFFIQANPLVPLVPPFILGTLLGETNITLWLVAAMAVMAILVYRLNALAGICLIACSVGWLNSAVRASIEPDASLYGNMCRYSAVVTDAAESESARKLTVIVDSVNRVSADRFKAALYIPSMLPHLRVGDRIEASVQLERLAYSPDLPDEYDYAKDLRHRGITATGIVGPDKIKVLGRENSIISWLDNRRAYITDLLTNSALSDDASSLAVTMMTGNDDYISEKWRGSLSQTGIAHILALSGIHVAVIGWVIAVILFPLTIMRLNRLRWIITICALWWFAVLTGMSDSVMRATIMTTVVIIALFLQRRTSVYNTLAFALLVIVFISPTSLYSISFQLTFAAVAAIVSVNPILCGEIDRRKHPYIFKIAVALATPISAVIGTGIISAYYFHIFPLLFLFPNIIAAFILPCIVTGSVFLIFMLAVGLDAVWLCEIINRLTSWLLAGTDQVAGIEAGTIQNVYISPVWVWCYILVVMLLVWGWYMRHKSIAYAGAIVLVTIGMSMSILNDKQYPEYEMYVTRESSCTDVLIKCRDTLLLRTTAVSPHARMDELERCRQKYSDYMGRRGIRAIILEDSCRLTDRNVESNGRLVRFKDRIIILVQSEDDVRPYGQHTDYVIVCKGYKGRIEEVWRIIGPDSLLLSADLNLRRHNRYLRSLKEMDDTRFRSLRETGLHLH